jgi:biotin carboxylase
MSEPRRPLLAIVYGEGSASAMSLSGSAAALCDIAWVVDSTEMADAKMLRLVRKLGQTVDLAGLSDEEAVRAVRTLQPDGIVAYADAHIARASALGESLGLEYFDRTVADRLLDKVVQRRALAEGGLPVPRCLVVPPHPSSDEVDALAAGVEFPVVLKPRHGAASRETHLVSDAAQLGKLLAQLPAAGPEPDMVIEEYMADAPVPPSGYFGDYVSVESVVAHGHISHLAVTGRLPSAKPFRETGLIIPTDYAPSLVQSILGVATDAIAAIWIRTGCLHTEIKVTDKGLRVIEVNGRIGGFVAPVLALASPGVDFFEISQRVALGEHVVFEDLVPTDHVGYVIVGQPPLFARHVVSVAGLDRVAAHPGVDAVALGKQMGAEVDWRKGSHEYVFSVLGTAPQHDDVRAMRQFIDDEVTTVYE